VGFLSPPPSPVIGREGAGGREGNWRQNTRAGYNTHRMPELTWTGKSAVKNHHDTVPFRLLKPDPELSLPSGAARVSEKDNLLVQGDNLLALKALLPYYAGQVKCIYIDPPYNTGNEGWVYNDNVNSPEMKEWIDKTVGKEAEDLNRHDKWLCMMYPRLQLLKQFLREDGCIAVSIDDSELSNLKLLMDEIFQHSNFLGTLIWKRRQNVDSRTKNGISIDHEYMIIYGRTSISRFRGQNKDLEKYKNPDNDPRGKWSSDNLLGLANIQQRPNLHYELIDPNTGDKYPCSETGWRYSRETMAKLISEGKILWPTKKTGRPRLKRFLNELKSDFTGFSSVLSAPFNTQATTELKSILDGEDSFDFPKPSGLVANYVEQTTHFNTNDIVLDCFAGSGTTGHAVLALNKEDGGNRRFILVEMDSHIAPNITAERLRRVASGYGETPGLGGGFVYCTLGEPLLDETGAIRSSVTWAELARHVFFSETGVALVGEVTQDSGFLGVHNGTAYYLLWNGDGTAALTPASLKKLPAHPDGTEGKRVVFAEACLLSGARLETEGIVFKQVPYEVKTR
jgi:adenine-specific DNA-methyltransferase